MNQNRKRLEEDGRINNRGKYMKKGQVSTELLIIVGLVLLVFIPLLVLVYFKANEANQQIASYQAELAVFRIAYLANSVGSLGTNTTVFTDVYIPKNAKSFTTQSIGKGGEIDMVVDTPQGPSEVVEVVGYPIVNQGPIVTPSPEGGWSRIKISSEYTGGQAKVRIEQA
ncbi:hypothetical protein HZC07_03490 [Candidatus Micrarchaeota archaeon]|nr:hypothetical protein [Candidatus Micrarchaeota archaeon]